jgi:hypothetical protein
MNSFKRKSSQRECPLCSFPGSTHIRDLLKLAKKEGLVSETATKDSSVCFVSFAYRVRIPLSGADATKNYIEAKLVNEMNTALLGGPNPFRIVSRVYPGFDGKNSQENRLLVKNEETSGYFAMLKSVTPETQDKLQKGAQQ